MMGRSPLGVEVWANKGQLESGQLENMNAEEGLRNVNMKYLSAVV